MRHIFEYARNCGGLRLMALPLVGGLLALTMAGCQVGISPKTMFGESSVSATGTGQPGRPIRLLIIFDASGSVTADKRKQMVAFVFPAVRAGIGHADMDFAVFDREVREIGRPTFKEPSDFIPLIKRDYLTQPLGRGTYFAPVAQYIQKEATQAGQSHQRLIAVVLTDGGFNDAEQVAKRAGSLNGLKNLDCLVIGPLTYEKDHTFHGSYFDAVQHDLDSFDQNRLICVPNEPQIAGDDAHLLEEKLR